MKERGLRSDVLMIAAFCAFSTPSVAADYWLAGDWCEVDGDERMFVDERSLGFNEHTICEWQGERPTGDTVDTEIACANVYVNGDEMVRMDARTLAFDVRRIEQAGISVRLGTEAASVFKRCDN